jgi:hypothetical protein
MAANRRIGLFGNTRFRIAADALTLFAIPCSEVGVGTLAERHRCRLGYVEYTPYLVNMSSRTVA